MPNLGQNHPQSGSFSPVDPTTWQQATYPLGAIQVDSDITFGVFSRRAERILLEIYDTTTGSDATHEYWMVRNPQDHIWRARINALPASFAYGFRCWGPNWPFSEDWMRGGSAAGFISDVDGEGSRFNPNKVLFDPYARELSHDVHSPILRKAGRDGRLFATGSEVYLERPQREHDTGRFAPKALFIQGEGSTGRRPRIPKQDAIIYEAHVRGLTQHTSSIQLKTLLGSYPGFESVESVPDELRGTFAGAAYMAPYLKALGFTAIELLPIHETDNDDNPDDRAGGNYWGYMTFGFFAPDRRYAHDKSPGGPTREFKAMVKAFHDVGLEVYLDVVYNHTGEGGNWKRRDDNGQYHGLKDTVAFTSLGGLDTVEYYSLTDDDFLADGATGCGNQLDFCSDIPQQLVLDSLTYWITEMGVDGFRFDLATVLGRKATDSAPIDGNALEHFHADHPLLHKIRDLGDEHEVDMIAEAWDCAGVQVGNFPARWGEWNGNYRDAVRDFLRSSGSTSRFVSMVNGDWDNFHDHGGPQHSVNFITAHDGFTLMDLVSYNSKNNDQPWPFGPSEGGTDTNLSWDSAGSQVLRRQRLRNFWTIQAFSRGIPLAVWGDEFGRTQNGNNNPYNIDSVATWSNYRMLATSSPHCVETGSTGAYHNNFGTGAGPGNQNPLFAFVTYVVRLRRDSPALKQRHYGDFAVDSGKDVTYQFKREDGLAELRDGDRCVWLRIDGSEVGETDFLLFINMYWDAAVFTIPTARQGQSWTRIIDTADWAESNHNVWDPANSELLTGSYSVAPRSIVVLREVRQP